MGYKKIILRSDQEPAIIDLKNKLKKVIKIEMIQEETPVGDSQSGGSIENAVKQVQGTTRSYKIALETNLNADMPEEHEIMPWVIKHAAANGNRFHMGKDGMTATRRLKGRNFRKEIAEMGECVWYLIPKSKGKDKLRSRWASGIFLGIRDESTEAFIGTSGGVIKVRTMRRKGSREERWNIVQINEMKGTPWQPQPGRNSYNIETKIVGRATSARGESSEIPTGVERLRRKNRFHIKGADIDKYCMSEDCEGCRRYFTGEEPRGHTEPCRDRIAQELMKEGDPRILVEVDRIVAQAELAREMIEPEEPQIMEEGMEDVEAEEDEEMADDEGEDYRGVFHLGQIMKMATETRQRDRLDKLNQVAGKKRHTWEDDLKKMNEILGEEENEGIVIDSYSAPRISAIAGMWKLLPGWSLDLTANDPDDGEPWNFNLQEKRDKAESIIKGKKALLVIGSPMCSATGQVKNKSKHHLGNKDNTNIHDVGEKHLEFCMKLYQMQLDNGMYFLHENAGGPENETHPKVKQLVEDWRVYEVEGSVCSIEMDKKNIERRKTTFITNAECIARRMGRKCEGGKKGILAKGERPRYDEIYTEDMCKEVIRGLHDQMKVDGRLQDTGVGCVFAMEEGETEWVFYDDVTGEALDWEGVIKAREEEIEEFRKHGVYHKVPITKCYEATGKAPIGVRWIDINKGDKGAPEYRSRLVAKEIKRDSRTDLFAATPPLEAKNLLFSMVVTKHVGYIHDKRKGMKIDFIDIRRAYFHAKARRQVFVSLPPEDDKEGMCGELWKSLYGTRDASQNWEEEYGSTMMNLGFTKGLASP